MSDASIQDRPRPRWPLWRIVLVYALMALLAMAAVWFIDRKVQLLPQRDPASAVAPTARRPRHRFMSLYGG